MYYLILKSTKKLLLYAIIFSTSRMLIGASSVIYLLQKGFTEKDIALLKSVQFIVFVLSDIPLGYFADKISKKLSILVSALCASIWLAITGVTNIKLYLYIAEGFNAISMSLYSGACIALLIHTYKKETNNQSTKNILSQYTQYTTLGMVIGVSFAAFFSFKNINMLWHIASYSCLLLFIIGLFVIKNVDVKQQINIREDFRKIKITVWKTPIIYFFLLNIIIIAYFNIVVQYNQIVLKYHFFQIQKLYIYSLFFIFILLSQSLAGYAIRKIQVTLAGLYGVAILLFVIIIFNRQSLINIVLWIILYGIFTMIKVEISSTLHNAITNELRATFDSAISTIARIVAFIMIYILYLIYVNITTLYTYSIVFFILQLGVYLLYIRQKKNTRCCK